MTDSERVISFQSEPDDGLLGVVTRAEQAVASAGGEPVGVLGIELERSNKPRAPELALEAAYAVRAGRGVVERLDVRVREELDAPPSDELLREALTEFGGTRYTNLCLAPVDGEELVDVTLHFGSRVPYWATCQALVAERLTASQAAAVEEVLATLGIACKRRGETLEVASHALRKPLDSEAQLRAFRAAVARRMRVELYAASLPVTRSVRLSLRPLSPDDTSRGFELACVLSRRLAADSPSAARDAVALKDFVARHFLFDFGAKSWRVENAHGEHAAHHPHGPMGDGRSLQWSLNWGARRR